MALTLKDREFLESLFADMHREIDGIQKQLDSTNTRVDELNRMVKGSNGYPGITTAISLLDQSVTQIKQTLLQISDDIHEQSATLAEYQRSNDSRVISLESKSNIISKDPSTSKNTSNEFMSWEWFREKALWPVVVGVAALLGDQILELIVQAIANKPK